MLNHCVFAVLPAAGSGPSTPPGHPTAPGSEQRTSVGIRVPYPENISRPTKATAVICRNRATAPLGDRPAPISRTARRSGSGSSALLRSGGPPKAVTIARWLAGTIEIPVAKKRRQNAEPAACGLRARPPEGERRHSSQGSWVVDLRPRPGMDDRGVLRGGRPWGGRRTHGCAGPSERAGSANVAFVRRFFADCI